MDPLLVFVNMHSWIFLAEHLNSLFSGLQDHSYDNCIKYYKISLFIITIFAYDHAKMQISSYIISNNLLFTTLKNHFCVNCFFKKGHVEPSSFSFKPLFSSLFISPQLSLSLSSVCLSRVYCRTLQ